MRALTALAALALLAACTTAPATGTLPQPVPASPEPSRHCKTDADCAVKNVGNCCGYFPACVNKDAPTFPEQVRRDCEREGRMAVCGFVEIESCRCVNQRCEPAPGGAEAL
ncbi:MAG: hypothetical protein KatS3mg126_0186 [Lysobacteraceae bacterium]|nr:MAG: hypothetical protein KatS3mg126_0186 [Xanthomonadaceae bacterium]